MRQAGKVLHTFDQVAEEFPGGYSNDLSLIAPSNPFMAHAFSQISFTEHNFDWINELEWKALRQGRCSLKGFDAQAQVKTVATSKPRDRQVRALIWRYTLESGNSQSQVVGEGIVAIQKLAKGDQNIAKWKQFAGRVLLYRAEPPLDPFGEL